MARTASLGQIASPLDEKDRLLLELVQKDARLSFAELGRRCGLSPPAAAERLKRLEASGVVTGYHAAVPASEMGLDLAAFIEVQVKRTDYPRFEKAIAKLAWVLECHHVSGRASFLLKVAVPNVAGLDLLIGHLSQFGETTTSLILSSLVERRVFER